MEPRIWRRVGIVDRGSAGSAIVLENEEGRNVEITGAEVDVRSIARYALEGAESAENRRSLIAGGKIHYRVVFSIADQAFRATVVAIPPPGLRSVEQILGLESAISQKYAGGELVTILAWSEIDSPIVERPSLVVNDNGN